LSKSNSSQRFKAIIAYDGTEFKGYQRQADRGRTVQGEIEDSLGLLGWEGATIWAAGRTDAGVHASGQVIAFDLDWTHTAAELLRAINSRLPAEIALREIEQTCSDFHPRYCAIRRKYIYRYLAAQVPDPLRARYVYRVWPEPNIERMTQAASEMMGEHDFSGFGSPTRSGGGTIRTVYVADVHVEEGEIRFVIEANSFLYRMVRKLAEILLQIGHSKLEVSELRTRLHDPTKKWTGKTAPARGLCLAEVKYE
jgi:tRNA pseudouridine38-40 synthase